MTAAVFVDSTTLLYSQDTRHPQKQARAAEWLTSLLRSDRMALSAQVLNETYAVVRRKDAFADLRSDIRPFLLDLVRWAAPAAPPDKALAHAWALIDRYRVGFWDALLLVSAERAGCEYFLSEDLNDGQLYGRVRVIDPFLHSPDNVLARPAQT